MDINSAIDVINGSRRSSDEKKHLRQLVRSGKVLASVFYGTPDYDEIIEDYPIESIDIYLIFIILLMLYI
jgi:hypothetical protein